jgi:uncharacterized protein YndB with AHSA1/START domain
MIWLLWIAGGLVGIVLVMMAVGSALPSGHVAQMAIDLAAPRERVWALISDVGGTARWRPEVKSIELQPPAGGRVRFVERTGSGATPFEVMSQEAPARQVVRVVDDGLPFGGTWTWELEPAGAGTRLTVTEDGFVRNPVFRVMSRLFFPPTGTMNTYLRSLARELGESTEPHVLRKR